jgi:hypothetical protein
MTILKLGKNQRLQVGDGASPETFALINGEQAISFDTTPDSIDGSSKDDGDYKIELYGQQAIKLSVNGVAKLPDPGLVRLDTARKTTGGKINIQIVDTLNANTVIFSAPMSVGAFKAGFDQKGAATYSFDLGLAGPPTVDALFGAGA